MSDAYFGSAEEAASELGAPLLVAASASNAIPRAGRRLSDHAVETVLGAHLFHRLRLASPPLPQVLWVTAPHGTLEHIGWAVGIAEHAASTGRTAYLAFLDNVQTLQGFANGPGLLLPASILAKLASFGIANAGGWVSDLQGVRLVFPITGEGAGDTPPDPVRSMVVVARAMPDGIETVQRYRSAADGVVLAAAIRDHFREELHGIAQALHGPGAPFLGVITMGPVPSGTLPIIERWERVLIAPEEKPVGPAPTIEPEPEPEPVLEAPPEAIPEPEPIPAQTPARPESNPAPAPEPAPQAAQEPKPEPVPESPPVPQPTRAEAFRPPVPPPAPPIRQPAGKKNHETPGRASGGGPPPRSASPAIVADAGEGIRPREEPVPLVASWSEEKKSRPWGALVAMIIALVGLSIAGILFRGDLVRMITGGGKPSASRSAGAPPTGPPAVRRTIQPEVEAASPVSGAAGLADSIGVTQASRDSIARIFGGPVSVPPDRERVGSVVNPGTRGPGDADAGSTRPGET
jgi:hypothetical protein